MNSASETRIAIEAFTKAAQGDMTAVGYATENIDGKLPQETSIPGRMVKRSSRQ